MNNPIQIKELRKLSKQEVMKYIFDVLKFDKQILNSIRSIENFDKIEHYRFDMTGFNDANEYNNELLNKFIPSGLYDKFDFIKIEFWKGGGTVKYSLKDSKTIQEFECSGYGTREIIYKILIEL